MIKFLRNSRHLVILSAIGWLAYVIVYRGRNHKGSREQHLRYDGMSTCLSIARSSYGGFIPGSKKATIRGGVAVAVIWLLFTFDEEISRWFRSFEPAVFQALKDFGWYYGSPENHYAINAGFYFYGLLTRNEELRKTGVLLISASLAAGILQTVSKIVIGRARPLREEGKASFRPFSKENSYYSFPSGHSILSFTTAYALGTQFQNPFLKVLMYFFGAIAPLSRLWAGAHWVTDAVTSVTISIPMVNTIDSYLKNERKYKTGLD